MANPKTKRHILDQLAESDGITQIADLNARRPVTPERRTRESARAQCAQLNRMLAAQRAWEPHERAAAGMDATESGRFAFSVEAQERIAHGLAKWAVPVGVLVLIGGAVAYFG